MTYFDTSVLVGVLLRSHPNHKECLVALESTEERFTSGHALAEIFSALTTSYKVPNDIAAELILSLPTRLQIEPLSLSDYETAIAEARKRGIMGGGIYDSLHATHARRRGASRIFTRDPGDFRHVAPDLEIIVP